MNTSTKGKKATGVVRSTSTLMIGLDIGYGVTKAITTDRVLEPFPSVYGLAREIKFKADEIAAKYPGDQISDEEGDWFVGNLALSQVHHGELIRLYGRTADDEATGNAFRVRMARVAIGKLLKGCSNGDVFHVRIATGLPVDHIEDAPALKAALIGRHIIKTDSADVVANITDVMVMPQPYGTIYSQTLTTEGEVNRAYVAESTGVCDVGTYTIDLAVDRNGEYIEAESGGDESGIYTARERIETLLERIMREKPSYQKVEEVLRTGRTKIKGEWKNFDSAVEEALESLRRTTLGLMSKKWRTGSGLDVVYISGGGGPLVEAQVKTVYTHAVLVSDSQLANAKGYLNYAVLTERNGG